MAIPANNWSSIHLVYCAMKKKILLTKLLFSNQADTHLGAGVLMSWAVIKNKFDETASKSEVSFYEEEER